MSEWVLRRAGRFVRRLFDLQCRDDGRMKARHYVVLELGRAAERSLAGRITT